MEIAFARLPKSFEEYIALSQSDLSTPENTCSMFLLALKLYVSDQDTGIKALNYLRGPRPLSTYDIQFMNDRLRDKQYLPLAYFNGAEPSNNYSPKTPFTIDFIPDPRPNDCEKGYMKLYLKTSGADAPRPIKLRQKDGKWYLWEYSSILTGIRIPEKDDAWV